MKCPFPDLKLPDDVSLYEFVFRDVDRNLDRVSITDVVSGEEVTYRTLRGRIESLSAALARRYGCVRGDTLAIYSTNSIHFVIVQFAAFRAGMRVALINPMNTANDLTRQLQDTDSTVLYTVVELAENVRTALKNCPSLRVVLSDKEEPGWVPVSSLYSEDASSFKPPWINPREDVALIPFSSGTTGKAKGVLLSHFNLVANVLQCRNIYSRTQSTTHPDEELHELMHLPQFHVYGNLLTCIALTEGANIVLCGPRFSPDFFLHAIQRFKIKAVSIAPPIGVLLAKHPMVEDYDLSCVDELFCSAAPLAKETEELLVRRLKLRRVRQAWGMTEVTSGAIANPVTRVKPGSVGIPIPNTEVEIVDEADNALGPYKRGEMRVKGPQVMKGYLKNPKCTADTIRRGWLYTGDVGYHDEDGYFYIVDRLKELIKYKAYQVPPSELEALLLTHPQVADAACIGKPDLEAGELPVAFVVRKEGATITEGQIRQFVDGQVAAYKKLRGGVIFVDEIPKSASGKILRNVLKETLKRTVSRL